MNTSNDNGSRRRVESPPGLSNQLYSDLSSDEPEVAGYVKPGIAPPEVLFISSYPPRECGIATYSQDLIKALNNKFGHSFAIKVCALEVGDAIYTYTDEVKYILNTSVVSQFARLAHNINQDNRIKIFLDQSIITAGRL